MVHCGRFLYEVTTHTAQDPPLHTVDNANTHPAVALTYKVGSQESFETMVKLWGSTVSAVHNLEQQLPPLTVLVIGFQDSQTHPEMAPEMSENHGLGGNEVNGEKFARQHGFIYAECDTRTGQGVKEAFTRVAEEAHVVSTRRFAGDSEGLEAFREQTKIACFRAMRACVYPAGSNTEPRLWMGAYWLPYRSGGW